MVFQASSSSCFPEACGKIVKIEASVAKATTLPKYQLDGARSAVWGHGCAKLDPHVCLGPWQEGWNKVVCKVRINPNHSVILQVGNHKQNRSVLAPLWFAGKNTVL